MKKQIITLTIGATVLAANPVFAMDEEKNTPKTHYTSPEAQDENGIEALVKSLAELKERHTKEGELHSDLRSRCASYITIGDTTAQFIVEGHTHDAANASYLRLVAIKNEMNRTEERLMNRIQELLNPKSSVSEPQLMDPPLDLD